MLPNATTSYYETDGLGTVTSLSNSAGALAQTYIYDSFGNTTNSSGSLTNPVSPLQWRVQAAPRGQFVYGLLTNLSRSVTTFQ